MTTSNRSRFAEGLAAGLVVTPAAVLGLGFVSEGVGITHESGLAALSSIMDWMADNLGYSVPVFALVLVLFVVSLARLRALLESEQPVAAVAHAEYLTDTWVSLFSSPT